MSERTLDARLPEPAPGFLALTGIHVRLLIRDAQAGSAALVLACLALPASALLTALPADPMDDHFASAAALEMFFSMMTVLMVATAFLWPEAVWRGLGPGDRRVLDAFPVTRRSHRMARVIAGAGLPLALLASIFTTAAILGARGWGEGRPGGAALPLVDASGWSLLTTVLVLGAAYLFSSALALRFGKVIMSLLVIGVVLYMVPAFLVIMGWEAVMTSVLRWTVQAEISPLRLLGTMFGGVPSDILPALFWLAVVSGAAIYLAGRHGKA